MDITDHILSKTNKLACSPEASPHLKEKGFRMFNDAGTEVEVSEFLYSMTRMTKPELVLETGTHLGVSSAYIGLGLEKNDRGKLITLEILPQFTANAEALWKDIGIEKRIDNRLISSDDFKDDEIKIDILFLDSEPGYRFSEFTKFFPQVNPSGLIIIHDLHKDCGHTTITHHGQYDWPYGDFREKIGDYIMNHDVQMFTLPTPRGLTIFQKAADDFNVIKYLKGTLEG